MVSLQCMTGYGWFLNSVSMTLTDLFQCERQIFKVCVCVCLC